MKAIPILSILLAIFIFAGDSYACGCISIVLDEDLEDSQEADYNQRFDKTLVKRAMEKADIIFVGEVVDLRFSESKTNNKPDIRYANFKVEKVWKGFDGEYIDISTSNRDFACGFSFPKGKRYLVYATKTTFGATTNFCTRTQPYQEDSIDEQYLGEPIKSYEEKKIETSTRNNQ